jgi:hypothetical protein
LRRGFPTTPTALRGDFSVKTCTEGVYFGAVLRKDIKTSDNGDVPMYGWNQPGTKEERGCGRKVQGFYVGIENAIAEQKRKIIAGFWRILPSSVAHVALVGAPCVPRPEV